VLSACSGPSRKGPNRHPELALIPVRPVIPKRPVLRSAAKSLCWIRAMWRLWCTPVHLSLHKTRIYHGLSTLYRTGDLIGADGVREIQAITLAPAGSSMAILVKRLTNEVCTSNREHGLDARPAV
jgi:hypothetical protein